MSTEAIIFVGSISVRGGLMAELRQAGRSDPDSWCDLHATDNDSQMQLYWWAGSAVMC